MSEIDEFKVLIAREIASNTCNVNLVNEALKMLILAGENPAVLSILTNNSEKPSSFLVSVNGYAAKHGRISNNQAKYVPKMVDSFIDQLSKKMGTFPPVTITNITVNNDGRQQTVESIKASDGKVHQGVGWPTLPSIFENTGLKLPTIRFLVNTNEGTAHKVRLRRLGESSANKGDIGFFADWGLKILQRKACQWYRGNS
jgi:hypothetical protein